MPLHRLLQAPADFAVQGTQQTGHEHRKNHAVASGSGWEEAAAMKWPLVPEVGVEAEHLSR